MKKSKEWIEARKATMKAKLAEDPDYYKKRASKIKATMEAKGTSKHKPNPKKTGSDCSKAHEALADPAKREEQAAKAMVTKSTKTLVSNLFLGAAASETIKERFFAVNPENGLTWYDEYITTFMKNAKENTSGYESAILAKALFSEDMIDKLDKQAQDAINQQKDFIVYRISQTLFDKQKEPFENNFDQQIMCICSRRAGKTELNARRIVKEVAKGKKPILYLNKTFKNAIKQQWQLVVDLCDQLGLVRTKENKAEGIMEFANGSSIMFGGVNDAARIEVYRGYKFSLVIIDEIGHIKNTKVLIEEILEPTQVDFGKEAQMYFTGTPPRIKNYAVELWNKPYIKKYHWTLADNPFIPDKEQVIEQVCKKKGVSTDDPYIQREYFGKMGVYDTDAMVFKHPKYFDIDGNLIKRIYSDNDKINDGSPTRSELLDIPKEYQQGFKPSKAYIGVDFGWAANNAVVGVVVDNLKHIGFSFYEDCFNKASVSDIVESVRDAVARAQTLFQLPFNDIEIIGDNSDRSIVYELSATYHLNAYPAYKYDKMMALAQLSEQFRTGRIKGIPGGVLAFEFDRTVYKRDETTDELLPELDDDLFHPDMTFALLYASRQWSFDWQEDPDQETRKPRKQKERRSTLESSFIDPKDFEEEDEDEDIEIVAVEDEDLSDFTGL